MRQICFLAGIHDKFEERIKFLFYAFEFWPSNFLHLNFIFFKPIEKSWGQLDDFFHINNQRSVKVWMNNSREQQSTLHSYPVKFKFISFDEEFVEKIKESSFDSAIQAISDQNFIVFSCFDNIAERFDNILGIVFIFFERTARATDIFFTELFFYFCLKSHL